MRKEIKQKWVDALRSGKYSQTQGQLRVTNDDGKASYCCLGVLCDIHRLTTKKKGNGWDKDDNYKGAGGTLPKVVQEWAGLTERDPIVLEHNNNQFKSLCLSSWNDNQEYSFKKIANLIEKSPL